MINFNFIKNFYLKESEKLDWLKKPKIAVLKGKDNHYTWFPDGQLNLYENCITKYLKKKSSKTAIITVDKNKDIKKYYPIDIFSDEAHCGTLANEQGSSRMYYHSYGDDELFDLMVDFKGYLNLAIEAKGFFYWPKYLLEHHYSKQSEERSNFKKEMPLLFPKFKIEEFNRLIDQNILK